MMRIWLAAAAVAAAAVAGVILLARGNDPGGLQARAPVTVSATLDPEAVEFGDVVTAAVTVLIDSDAVDSSSVRVREDLAPLTQLGLTSVTRTQRGGVFVISYVFRASCLDQRCIGSGSSKRVSLRPVVVELQSGNTTANWPVLDVRSRVSRADVARPHPPMRSDAGPPPVSYRFAPGRLARALEATAVVLALAGVLLAAWTAALVVRRRRRVAPLSGIERALVLVREAERRSTADRRRAVGLLARLLGSRDTRLADAADDIAWSAPPPTPDALSSLAGRVEREVDGR